MSMQPTKPKPTLTEDLLDRARKEVKRIGLREFCRQLSPPADPGNFSNVLKGRRSLRPHVADAIAERLSLRLVDRRRARKD